MMTDRQSQVPEGMVALNLLPNRATVIEREGCKPLVVRFEKHQGKWRILVDGAERIRHFPLTGEKSGE